MNQGPIGGRFMKKTRGQKTRATVPLMALAYLTNPIYGTFEQRLLVGELKGLSHEIEMG
jgi:hypothetical protein